MDIPEIVMLSKSEGFRMVFLLVMWAELLFGGYLIGRVVDDNRHRMPVWTRITSSFVLVLAAWSWWYFMRDSAMDVLSAWIALGMTLGFIGDLFMAQLLPFRRHVLAGMFAFGVGHVAYIIGLWQAATRFSLDNVALIVTMVLLSWGIAVAVWVQIIYRPAQTRTFLHFAALPYGVVLATTGGMAIALALQDWAFVLVALGAVLFLASDVILSLNLFNNVVFRRIHDVVWLTYGPGQMFIVYGLAFFALGISTSLIGL